MSWMRQESEFDRDIPPSPARGPATAVATRESRPPTAGNVNIGQSVQIKGTLVGKEDLTIDGKVEGKIRLREHVLTIGTHGVIEADVHAKTVVVHGKLTGNVSADDKVEIASTGSVKGDIRAPRVAILDGATFKGGIDMGGEAEAKSGKFKEPPHRSGTAPVAGPASTGS